MILEPSYPKQGWTKVGRVVTFPPGRIDNDENTNSAIQGFWRLVGNSLLQSYYDYSELDAFEVMLSPTEWNLCPIRLRYSARHSPNILDFKGGYQHVSSPLKSLLSFKSSIEPICTAPHSPIPGPWACSSLVGTAHAQRQPFFTAETLACHSRGPNIIRQMSKLRERLEVFL